MKKILLAATALVVTAGAAVADVRISGYGRFGIGFNDANERNGIDDWQTQSRLRLQFDVSTTTDAGLTIGARQRFQTEENAANNGGNAARFYASYAGLTIAMGNILGVIENSPMLYQNTRSAGMGLEGDGFHALAVNTASNGGRHLWTAYDSADAGARNGVEILYSFQDVTLHAHHTNVSYGIGVNGSFEGFRAALSYEQFNETTAAFDDGDDILFAALGYSFGDFDASLGYGRTEIRGLRATKWSAQGGYNIMPELYAYGFVARENNDIGTSAGIGVSYDLGGGASVEAGYTSGRVLDAGTVYRDNIVSAGIFFAF